MGFFKRGKKEQLQALKEVRIACCIYSLMKLIELSSVALAMTYAYLVI
jgi:hypothetical protein